MKRFGLLFIASWLAVAGIAQKKKAIFVIADGIPADLIEKLETPALDAIAKVGGYNRVIVGGEKGGYSQTPTISAVGYNTVLTGTWVNKHNVWDNDIAEPNYHYPTIFRLFKEQYPDRKIAIFSSWLDNRTKLVGDGLPATGNIRFDHHFDGLEKDTVKYPHDKETKYMHLIDEAVITDAANSIRTMAPDLSWVYLEYTDDMGHRFGDSPQFYDAIKMMDSQVGRLYDAIQYREKQFGEEWQIYITTDHGRDSATGHNHGGQSERERRGWIVTNAKGLNDYFRKGHPSIADIMPSIAQFLDIKLPTAVQREIDGTPLTGKLGAVGLSAAKKDNTILVSWQPVTRSGKAKIWLATTNEVKTGGTDTYQLVAEPSLKDGKATIPVPASHLYKVVLETPYNTLNRWVLVKE